MANTMNRYGKVTTYHSNVFGEIIMSITDPTDADKKRARRCIEEFNKRMENLVIYGTSHPESIDVKPANYDLGPGATGICQLNDFKGMV